MAHRRRRTQRLWQGEEVPVICLLEMLCAVHLSSYVESPFKDAGGLMIVGPPGMMKSTGLDILDANYADALSLTDINAQMLNKLRNKISQGAVRTLVLPELSKLYERNPATAANVEGTLRALVSEGFAAASYEDATLQRYKVRATVIAALVPSFRDKNMERWDDSGFARRFLWSMLRLQRPDVLEDAVEEWKLVDFGLTQVPPVPTPAVIPNLTTKVERAELRRMLKTQPPPHAAQFQMLAKSLAVLKWWKRNQRKGDSKYDAFDTVCYFARSLGKHGGTLVV